MIKQFLSVSIVVILLYACATVQSPTGGEKDEKAPILYESKPKDQSVAFNGKEITLYFNEWMKLEQINKELIITPRSDIEYEATLKKQELLIELKEELEDSTTYTFNFRKALSDVTEGNLWENPIIAFSTGQYLDSLQINGKLTQLMNQKAAEGYTVGLYDATSDTANLRQGKPVYFTTTDKKGEFSMKNLKAGHYILYAFSDKNDNLINDPQSESFGFHPDTLHIVDSIAPIAISTYKLNEDTLKLKKYSPVGKDFIVQYNKGLSKYQITNPSKPEQHIYANDIEQSKYLQIYKENFPDLAFETDSVALQVQVTDSTGQSRQDTVFFKIRESRLTNDELKITDKPKGKITSGNQQFLYNFSKPIAKVNYDSIQLRIDSISIKTFTSNQLTFNYNKKEAELQLSIQQDRISNIIDSLRFVSDSLQQLQDSLNSPNPPDRVSEDSVRTREPINKQTKKGNANANQASETRTSPLTTGTTVPRGNQMQNTNNYQLQLYMGKGAFVGLESDSSSSTSVDISFKEQEDYGIIKGKVLGLSSDYIIQLLSKNYELVDTLINKEDYQFSYVKPGNYRIRLIQDNNSNGKWDPGNPLTLNTAEPIYYLDEEIIVKANWEVLDKTFDFTVDNTVNEGEQTDDL